MPGSTVLYYIPVAAVNHYHRNRATQKFLNARLENQCHLWVLKAIQLRLERKLQNAAV